MQGYTESADPSEVHCDGCRTAVRSRFASPSPAFEDATYKIFVLRKGRWVFGQEESGLDLNIVPVAGKYYCPRCSNDIVFAFRRWGPCGRVEAIAMTMTLLMKKLKGHIHDIEANRADTVRYTRRLEREPDSAKERAALDAKMKQRGDEYVATAREFHADGIALGEAARKRRVAWRAMIDIGENISGNATVSQDIDEYAARLERLRERRAATKSEFDAKWAVPCDHRLSALYAMELRWDWIMYDAASPLEALREKKSKLA